MNADFQRTKELIKGKLDLVQILSEDLPLKRSGRSFKGLCPFHDEKTPSFHVFPESQHFKCFGCGKGGDIFTYVMEREHVGFGEAFRMLAERCGVPLPRSSPGERRGAEERRSLHGLLELAGAFFRSQLHAPPGEEARAYLEGRGLSGAIPVFGLGFAPGGEAGPGRSLVEQLRREGAGLDPAIRLGLVGRSRHGTLYDRFRNRLMFPIHDERGRVVGFGGRILPGHESEHEPKYLNSPESPVFNKRRLLFGLHLARQERARQERARQERARQAGNESSLIVMEGYTDVVASWLSGIHNAVATLGTSLTPEHAALLRRFAPAGVTLLFDGDRAGRVAAERAFAALAAEILPARICLLEEGEDPAGLVRGGGAAALSGALEKGRDALEVFLELLDQRLDASTHQGKALVAEACREILRGVQDPLRREDLLERMSARLFLSPELMRAGIRRRPMTRPGSGPGAAAPSSLERSLEEKARETLLAALLCQPSLLPKLEETWAGEDVCLAADFPRSLVAKLRETILGTGDFPDPPALLSAWLTLASGDSAASELVLRIEAQAATLDDPELALGDGVGFFRKLLHRRDLDRLRDSLRRSRQEGDEARSLELESELSSALRRVGRPRRRGP
ncbi:MAG: DNA primase [Planctomycetota bacterium]